MISNWARLLIAIFSLIQSVNLQISQPIYEIPSQMYAYPQPLAPTSPGIAVPMEVPAPVQIAVPAYPPPEFCKRRPRPYNCPVCPPCLCYPCTPAFFSYCSPCHQKCRCRDIKDVPIPLPPNPPVPVPGPAFPIPLPIADPLGLLVPVHSTLLHPNVQMMDDDY